jgi:hypothetical protein
LRRGRLLRVGAKRGSENRNRDAAEKPRTKPMRAQQPK